MAEQDFMTDEAMYDKALLDSLLLNNEIDAFRDEFLNFIHTTKERTLLKQMMN